METKESKKTLWVIVGIVVGVLAIFIILATMILGSISNENKAITTADDKPVASKEDVAENLKGLATDIDQSAKDQKAAEAALEDDSKRVKLGE